MQDQVPVKKIHLFVNPTNLLSKEVVEIAQRCAGIWDIETHIIHDGEKIEENEMIATVGGDGTMIRALRQYPNNPIWGINLGTLGFLTETEANQGAILDMMHCLSLGDYTLESCYSLHYTVKRPKKNSNPLSDDSDRYEIVKRGSAINDVVIARNSALDGINFSVRVNGHVVNRCFADAYVVASPVGSSAYALSGGGPLVEPTSDVLVLCAIAPHTLSNRSIVIDGESTVSIVIERMRSPEVEAIVCADGTDKFSLKPYDVIEVEQNWEGGPNFVRSNDSRFFDRVARRMAK